MRLWVLKENALGWREEFTARRERESRKDSVLRVGLKK